MTNFFSKTTMISYLKEVFPQVNGKFDILELSKEMTIVKLKVQKADLRPGDTVSGPSMFLLADVSFYIAVLNLIGPRPLAVTTNCSINFLRKPKPTDLIGQSKIFKSGRNLIVGEVTLKSELVGPAVAHATFTYAIPQKNN